MILRKNTVLQDNPRPHTGRLPSTIDDGERYFGVFPASLSILTSLSISRHVRNST
jgi:hypothetical protein